MCALNMLLIKATYLLTYVAYYSGRAIIKKKNSTVTWINVSFTWEFGSDESICCWQSRIVVYFLSVRNHEVEWDAGNKTTVLDSIMLQQNWFRGVTVVCISMTSDFYWLKWYCHFVIPCNWQPSVCERVILAQRRRYLLPCLDDDKAVITRWRHKELCTAPGLLSLASFSAGKRR